MEDNRLHERYMRRCFDLARLGEGRVSPNPMVGAVLVHQQRIIGEGYHRQYGEAHAEVKAVSSVPSSQRHLIPQSTLYISLEPCCVFGRTPPCTDMILREGIPRVIISTLDTSPEVSGKSVALLRARGVEVVSGVLELQGKALFAPRDRFARLHRPYITLKFARTREGLMAPLPLARKPISSPLSQRLVHRWRSEHDAILVGFRTALTDDPELTNRLYPIGDNPLRVVLDPKLELPKHLKVFDGAKAQTLVAFDPDQSEVPEAPPQGISYLPYSAGMQGLPDLLGELRSRNVSRLLVEGGAAILHQFLEADLWDEARVLEGAEHMSRGVKAPVIPAHPAAEFALGPDRIIRYLHSSFER